MKKYFLTLILAIVTILPGRAGKLMDLRLENGRLMAEIPESMTGKKLFFASIIESISDPGEGVAGQLSDNCLPVMFNVEGDWLNVRYLYKPYLETPDTHGLMDYGTADFQRYKISSVTSGGSVRVDLTDFFLENFTNLNIFPKNAYNSQGGTVMRVHTLNSQTSSMLSTEVTDSIASVRCDLSFKMDGYVYGMMKVAGDFSVRAVVRKMIFLPAYENEMPELEATPYVGTENVSRKSICPAGSPVEEKSIVSRYRIPERHLNFRIDPLVPGEWKPFIEEGVDAWNRAFEAAGIGRTLETSVLKPGIDEWSPYESRIIYATSGMHSVDASTLTDPLSGERISSTICIHDDVIAEYASALKRATAASWPDVRQRNLPDSITGSIVRLLVMQAVGKCLGLTANLAASSVYPVDSLRSASFTSGYGLSASVMETPVFNYVAQPQDAGVRYVQDVIGPYDIYALGRLYGRKTDAPGKYCQYFPSSYNGRPSRDPFVSGGDLGYNHFRTMDYFVSNQKMLFSNALQWFCGEGEDYSEVESILKGAADDYAVRIVHLLRYVGGYRSYLNNGDYPVQCLTPLPAGMQKAAVKEIVARLRDMEWFDSAGRGTVQYGTVEFIADVYRTNIFRSLLGCLESVEESSRDFGPEYSPSAFLMDVADEIFGVSMLKTGLKSYEMVWQTAFVEYVGERSDRDSACLDTLRKLKYMVAGVSVPESDRSHYEYIAFMLNRLCDD